MFLTNDLGVRHALDRLGIDVDRSAAFSPWRSYAVHHLWASLSSDAPPAAAIHHRRKETT